MVGAQGGELEGLIPPAGGGMWRGCPEARHRTHREVMWGHRAGRQR